MSVFSINPIGRVIILNGASSSGRSSISACLKTMLPDNAAFVSLADVYHKLLVDEALSLKLIHQEMPWLQQYEIITKNIDSIFITLAPKRLNAIQEFYRHIKALSNQYRYVIVHTMFYIIEIKDLEFFLEEMKEADVLYVLIHCPAHKIAERLIAKCRLIGGRVIPNLQHICRMYVPAKSNNTVDIVTKKEIETMLAIVHDHLQENNFAEDAIKEKIIALRELYHQTFFKQTKASGESVADTIDQVAIAASFDHDIVVNTSKHSSEECAQFIYDKLMQINQT